MANGGDYFLSLDGAPVCITFPDDAVNGFPTIDVTGVSAVFEAGTDNGLTFNGQASVANTLDLTASSTVTVVSVPAGTVQVGAGHDSFSGITSFVGSASGNTAFVASAGGGYSFSGHGSGNVLDLGAAGSGLSVSVPAGTVTGLSAGGSDQLSGIANFDGSSSGGTTLVAGSGGLSFAGHGTGNVLDFSQVSTSPAAPLCINVSGAPASTGSCGPLANNSADVGLFANYSFDHVSGFSGSGDGFTTFLAGGSGGFTFSGQGFNNTLDLSAAGSGVSVSVPTGTVSGLISAGVDRFSAISTFDGSGLGGTSFTAGSADNDTFNGAGNGNTFVAGGGSDTFNGGPGFGNELDFSPVATSSVTPLRVNLSGNTVFAVANNSAAVGSTNYRFSGITTFDGATDGYTAFYASGSGGGLTFNGDGSGNTLDLTASSTVTVVSVPAGIATIGALQDSFSGITSFTGSEFGNTTFVASGGGGYSFTGQGSGNALDLTGAGPGLSVSTVDGTVGGLASGGDDEFSGITHFTGSSSGGTTLVAGFSAFSFSGKGAGNAIDFSQVATAPSVPLWVNVSGFSFASSPYGLLANDSAEAAFVTDTFTDVTSFSGSSSGNGTFFAGGDGGYAFSGQGFGNTLDLTAAPVGTTVTANGNSPTAPGSVTGLTSGTDSFSGIQSFSGPVTITPAAVTGVSSTLADGSYGVNKVVPITVSFNEPVTVAGTPQLALNSGGTASYTSGSGSNALTFTYTVAAGENANPLDEASASALTLSGGAIAGTFTNPVPLTLPTPGTAGSLGVNKTIVIDSHAIDFSQVATSPVMPLVVNVSGASATSPIYGPVSNDTAVVGGVTYNISGLTSFTGSSSGNTSFLAGGAGGYTFIGGGSAGNVLDLSAAQSGVSVSVPAGTVGGLSGGADQFSGIRTFDGPSVGGSTFRAGSDPETFDSAGNGNTFVAGSGNAVFNGGAGHGNMLDFSPVVTSAGTSLRVNVSGVQVGAVANNGAAVGSTVYQFSGIATFDGAIGGHTTFYASGSSANYTFNGSGSGNTLDLSESSSSPTLVSVPAGTVTIAGVQDSFSGIQGFVGAAAGNTAFVASGAGGFSFSGLGSGNSLDLSAAGSGLTVSVPDGTVTGLSGGGGSDLVSGIAHFIGSTAGQTTVAAGSSALSFQGQGTGNALGFSSVSTSPLTPLLINVTGGPDGGLQSNTATVGAVTYTFSDVAGFTGSSSGNTSFLAGGTGGYTFNGQASGNTLDLTAAGPGAIVTVNGNSPDDPGFVTGLTGGTDSFSGIQQITGGAIAPPTVTGVSSTTANGSYTVGKTIAVTVSFSEPVNVTGTPQLALNSGGTASYSSGSGTSMLTFAYTVGASQNANPLDEVSPSSLSLNGGAVSDLASNAANLMLPAPGTAGSLGVTKSIVIDTIPPTVSGVSSTTANGSYTVGAVVRVTVAFSEPVNVAGTPQFALNSGGTASYASGSGTSTLTFTYTVGAGQNANPLDEASASALTLNGGTIKDAATNPANLSLPAPGAAGSLGVSKSIVIDTVAPTVSGVSSTTANGSYTVGKAIAITVSFGKPVNVTGAPQLALDSGGIASYSSGSGSSTLTFTYTVGAGQNSNLLDEASAGSLSLNGGTISDLASNAAVLTVPAPGTAGSLGVNTSIVIDTSTPTITISTAASEATTGWYNIASSGTNGILVAVSATDSSGVSSLSCKDGTTSVLNTTSSGSFTLNNGNHNISCSASDGLGNSGASASSTGHDAGPPSTANAEFEVDQTAPAISHAIGGPRFGSSPIYVTSATGLTFSVSDATSGVQTCSITVTDPSSHTHSPSCASGDNTYKLNSTLMGATPGDGSYTNEADLTDVAGNQATQSSSVALDNTGPTISITTLTDGATYLINQQVKADFGCTDSGSGIASCTGTVAKGSPINTTTVGSHSFTVNASDNLANAASKTVHYTVVYAFGGFQTPKPKPVLTYKSGSHVAVKFTFTDASGHSLSANTAAALAAAGNVKIVLSGPNGNTVQASATCSWVAKGAFFQCDLQTPSGLKTGMSNVYTLTALENVGSGFVTAPPHTNSAADANPETVYFK